MNELNPINQTRLFGLNKYLSELINLYNKEILPNKILLSGQKGSGKSTLAYHFINYVLSIEEQFGYDTKNCLIKSENRTFKTILNKSNPNLITIDVNAEKKNIDINQIRELILNLNKSSFNTKPRFVLIDNIEFLNKNSINALLKVLEEPGFNIHFILINNNKKILSTLLSRCIIYKISLSNNECLNISNKLLDANLDKKINSDLLNYYLTPGNMYKIFKFAENNNYDLLNVDLKDFLKLIIQDNHYKKDNKIKFLIYDLIEFYFRKINSTFKIEIYNKYSYFIRKIYQTQIYNLDEELLFTEFYDDVLNG